MNIFASSGFQVALTEASADNGSDADKKDVMTHLKFGEVYTVKNVHTFSPGWSMVMLNELPCLLFNAACLEDVNKQSKEDDKKHPQWELITWELMNKQRRD
jgi:hypothetical protein